MHKFFLTTLVAGVLAVTASSCSGKSSQNESTSEEGEWETVTPEGYVYYLKQGEVIDINETPERLTIFDFNATWCGPCQAFGPIFEEAAKKYYQAKFISVDIDEHKELAESLQITSIPAVLFIYPDGTKEMSVGLMDYDEFSGKIDSALKKIGYTSVKVN